MILLMLAAKILPGTPPHRMPVSELFDNRCEYDQMEFTFLQYFNNMSL